jgi:endoglucanase
MKKILSVLLLCISSSYSQNKPSSPVEVNGWLQVKTNKICNQSGQPTQLRGIATHGLQWFGDFYNDGKVISTAIDHWGADVIRLSVYVYEKGYLDNKNITPADFDLMIDKIIQTCVQRGAYCIIDWHIHHPGDPAFYLKDAKKFFAKMSKKYGKLPNIIYEIANEPNPTGLKGVIEGRYVTWQNIKDYAQEIIPIIRKNAPKSLIFVGTPSWSSFGISSNKDWREITNSPIDATNIAYVVHFYAAGHKYSAQIDKVAQHLPLFVTEWAAASWSVDSKNDVIEANKWLDVLNKHKIGWTYWSFAPGNSIFSPFKKGTASTDNLSPNSPQISETGKLLYLYLNTPQDNWVIQKKLSKTPELKESDKSTP